MIADESKIRYLKQIGTTIQSYHLHTNIISILLHFIVLHRDGTAETKSLSWNLNVYPEITLIEWNTANQLILLQWSSSQNTWSRFLFLLCCTKVDGTMMLLSLLSHLSNSSTLSLFISNNLFSSTSSFWHISLRSWFLQFCELSMIFLNLPTKVLTRDTETCGHSGWGTFRSFVPVS